ncbi:outer membrane autotransporter barrel domain protein [Lysobacter gummosus]|nr:outer membrane autotransporter barrel domain protein [Lysobacter gummosus]
MAGKKNPLEILERVLERNLEHIMKLKAHYPAKELSRYSLYVACREILLSGALKTLPMVGLVSVAVLAVPPALASQCATTDGGNGGDVVLNGGTCSIPSGYNPVDNDQRVGGAYVDQGDRVTLIGNAQDISAGDRGQRNFTLGELDASASGKERLLLGGKGKGVSTPDPITGGRIVVATYDSAAISSADWGALQNAATSKYVNVGDQQYVDARLGTAQGGTLVVDIGNRALAPSAAENSLDLALKQTQLTRAAGDGSAVRWASRNRILAADVITAASGATTRTVPMSIPTYAGTFAGFDGRAYTVNNVSDLKNYNDLLIAALEDGRLNSQAAYDSAFAQAVSYTTQNASFSFDIDPGDEITVAGGINYSMYVDGVGALGVIENGAQIDQRGARVASANGGRVVIEAEGQLSGHFSSLEISSGGSAQNNGAISAGYYADNEHDTTTAGTHGGAYVEGFAVTVDGNGSAFENRGIINVAGFDYAPETAPDQYGVLTRNGGATTNRGVVNVGVNNGAKTGAINGALIAGSGSSFINEAEGLIYIGRAAQYSPAMPEAVSDTSNHVMQRGIYLDASAGGTAINEGAIVIGTKTENAIGMGAVGSNAQAQLRNRGEIIINGASRSAPLENLGLLAQDNGSTVIANDGIIRVNGINGVGLKVLSANASASAVSSAGSRIEVNGTADPASGVRNYGAWIDGSSANALLEGDILLAGRGAIGVHARNGGLVSIGPSAAVKFIEAGDSTACPASCSDQIGYFVYGKGSRIEGRGGALDVNTSRSTLLRVENGAAFSTSAGQQISASGVAATAIQGSGSEARVDIAGARLVASGSGATLLKIDGGATGIIGADTEARLAADRAIAGLVDGRKYELSGQPSSEMFPSRLEFSGQVIADSKDARGFIAQASGVLVHRGTTQLADGVGITVRDGGVLQGGGSVLVQNGTGLLLDGAASSTDFNAGASITTLDGDAAIRVRNQAWLETGAGIARVQAAGSAHGVVLSEDAKGAAFNDGNIIVDGQGNGIENNAAGGRVLLNRSTLSVTSGAGIRNLAAAQGVSSFSLVGARIASASGWGIQAESGTAKVNVTGGRIEGGAGALFTGSSAQLEIYAQQASLVGRALTEDGGRSSVTLDAASLWEMKASSNVSELVNRNSSVDFGVYDPATGFKRLTIAGNYVGDGGRFLINTKLGDDQSPTDLVRIMGNSSGASSLQVTNAGGLGAQTVEGIKVVQVGGTSDARFLLSGRAVAGAYEYLLQKGGIATPADGDWYLRSYVVVPPKPVPPKPEPPERIVRPEVGAYLANQSAAEGLFRHSLHDRLGEPNLAERMREGDALSSAWVRTWREQADYTSVDQLDTNSDSSGLQVGSDLARWGERGRGQFGAMLAIGQANNHVRSLLTGYFAKGKVDGRALGLYATWFADPVESTGLYMDGWLQYARFDNRVEGLGLARESYDSSGSTVSIEAGYSFRLRSNGRSALFLEPQGQLIYSDFDMESFTETGGTHIDDTKSGGLTTRLGLRLYGHAMGDTGNRVQPFATLNWWNQSSSAEIAFNRDRVRTALPRDRYQLKLGVQLQLGGGWTGWGQASAETGSGDYRDIGGLIGTKYSW